MAQSSRTKEKGPLTFEAPDDNCPWQMDEDMLLNMISGETINLESSRRLTPPWDR